MKYRKFGRSDWQVSEIGFGGWQLGGTWGHVDDEESISTLLYAFEQGINFVDTAVLYGQGRSESVIGKALRSWSDSPIHVATKVPPVVWDQQDDIDAPMQGRYPEAWLREHVDNSLSRLGVDRIDLLQLHGWYHRGVYELDWLETLNALRIEGKIDKIGVSLHDARPDQGVAIAKLGLVDSIQVVFNIFDPFPLDELFPAALESGTAIIARVPLDSGSLSGTWNADTIKGWEVGDKRHAMYAKDGNFEETLHRIEAIKETCAPTYPNLAEAALRYSLHHESVAMIIPGMRNQHEVDLNTRISDGATFPPELVDALRPHAWNHVFY